MCYLGIDSVRQNCGGAGFLNSSGLPQIFGDYSPVPVYEGDNTVMAQQNLNYFEKLFRLIKENKPMLPLFDYLRDLEKFVSMKSNVRTLAEFSDIDNLDKALCVRAAHRVKSLFKRFAKAKGVNKKLVLNELFSQDIVLMSRSHMLYLAFLHFRRTVEEFAFEDLRTQ